MSCPCFDPAVFGHQSRRCLKSLQFGLDDEDAYLRTVRDDAMRNHWYAEEHDAMTAAEKHWHSDSLLRRVLFRLLGVRRKAL